MVSKIRCIYIVITLVSFFFCQEFAFYHNKQSVDSDKRAHFVLHRPELSRPARVVSNTYVNCVVSKSRGESEKGLSAYYLCIFKPFSLSAIEINFTNIISLLNFLRNIRIFWKVNDHIVPI